MRIVAYRYQAAIQDEATADPWESASPPLDHLYVDQGMAAQPDYRPQLAQLLADNQANPADLLLVEHLAALGHNLEAVQTCLDSLAAQGTVVIPLETTTGEIPTLETLADLPQLQAKAQSINLQRTATVQDHQRRQQMRAGHARNRLKALPPPGKAPYGYRRGQERYLIDRTTAPVITAFVNEFLLYGSLRGAVRFVETRFGKRMAVSTGRRWLTHPVYRGDLQYQDGQVIRDTHAALISRDEAAQIDRLLRRNRPLPPRTAGASRSLAGLVQCQACGSPMTISTTTVRGKAQSYLYLRPATCPQTPRCSAISYNEALEKIIAEICQTLPQAVAQLQSRCAVPDNGPPPRSPLTRLQDQIQQKEVILTQLPTLVETGVLDTETADLRRYKLRGELAQLKQQIAQLPPVNLQELAQSVSIPQFWFDLSEAERRFFFREFLQRIDIVREGSDWRIALVLVF